MRSEVLELIKQDERVMDGLQFGKFEGDDFVVVEGWDVIERMDEILNNSGIEHRDAESELGEFGFDDEYTSCGNCGTFIKTTPDFYGSHQKFVIVKNELCCLECAKDYKEEYIEEHINNASKAIILNFVSESDLEEIGFKRYNTHSFSSGFHQGMDDEPKVILDKLKPYYDEIVFTIDETSQFYTSFSAWVRSA